MLMFVCFKLWFEFGILKQMRGRDSFRFVPFCCVPFSLLPLGYFLISHFNYLINWTTLKRYTHQ